MTSKPKYIIEQTTTPKRVISRALLWRRFLQWRPIYSSQSCISTLPF